MSSPIADGIPYAGMAAAPRSEGAAHSDTYPISVPLSDETLLQRLQVGDSDAMELLFKRYSGLVWAIAARLLRNDSDADDLVQDVFLFLFRAKDLFDAEKGSARSWIVHVTYHRAFNRQQYLKSRCSQAHESLEEIRTQERSLTRAPSMDLGSWICLKAHLERAFENLTEEQRCVIRLRFFEGYTFQEISRELGQAFGNVRNHYYRGLERLRQFAFKTKMRENPQNCGK